MRKEIETYELIEKFLSGALTGPEADSVRNRIEHDPDFASEVNQHKQVQNLIIDRSLIEIKDKIQDIHSHCSASSGNRFNTKNLFSIFGGIVLLGVIAAYFLLTKQVPNEVILVPISDSVNIGGSKSHA